MTTENRSGGSATSSRDRWLVGLALGILLAVQLVPIFLAGTPSLPLPLRHAPSEAAELRLWLDAASTPAAPDAYETTLLPLPGWLHLVVAGALGRLLNAALVARLLLGLALGGATLGAWRFGARAGRPLAALVGAAAAGSTAVLAYGPTAHLLSLAPFWWGAVEIVKLLDDRDDAAPRRTRGRLAIAALLCAALSAASFAVLCVGALPFWRRDRRILIELTPSLLLLFSGALAASGHYELVPPGDPWQAGWAGVWPIVRDLPAELYGALPSSAARLLSAALALALVTSALLRRRVAPNGPAKSSAMTVAPWLFGGALFLFFYLPRSLVLPVAAEAVGLRLVVLWLPLGFVLVGELPGARALALLPAAVAAIVAPLTLRAQLASQRPLAPYLLTTRTAAGGLVCVLGGPRRRADQSPISVDGRSETGALWALALRGGALPLAPYFPSALAVRPKTPPTLPSYVDLVTQGLAAGSECTDYLVHQPPPILERDPTIERRDERADWVHYHRNHPRPETP